jgi:predicted short-subunit dehydrogenase-like oxidoreductase (DUF2520 family)
MPPKSSRKSPRKKAADKSTRKTARRNTPARQPTISIVGPGRLGSALAVALHNAGYEIDEVITHGPGKSRGLARSVGARPVALKDARLDSDIIWLTVGDSAIRSVAYELAANHGDWSNKIAFHSSGALTSHELAVLKEHGASVASVHPLMTFSGGHAPSLVDVFFAIEGDARAVRAAETIVRVLGCVPMQIKPQDKAAYHAWASFGSPLLIALLSVAERLAGLAGLDRSEARHALVPLLQQTLDNYAIKGGDNAFTGPWVRGDVDTIRKHLDALQGDDTVRGVYIALAMAALKLLPAQNANAIAELLQKYENRCSSSS